MATYAVPGARRLHLSRSGGIAKFLDLDEDGVLVNDYTDALGPIGKERTPDSGDQLEFTADGYLYIQLNDTAVASGLVAPTFTFAGYLLALAAGALDSLEVTFDDSLGETVDLFNEGEWFPVEPPVTTAIADWRTPYVFEDEYEEVHAIRFKVGSAGATLSNFHLYGDLRAYLRAYSGGGAAPLTSEEADFGTAGRYGVKDIVIQIKNEYQGSVSFAPTLVFEPSSDFSSGSLLDEIWLSVDGISFYRQSSVSLAA